MRFSAEKLTALMAERGLDDLAVAQRLAARPWVDRALDLVEERQLVMQIRAYETQVRRWRTGKHVPRGAQIRLLAAVLGVTADQLEEEER